MGRNRKPLDAQAGNLTVDTKERKAAEEQAVATDKDQIQKPPTWLIDSVAKKEWKRVVKELDKISLVGNLDKNNLAGYCNAFANYLKVTKLLKGQDYCIERETRTGTIIVKNPLVDIQKSYAEEMRRFASLCGMTIDARLKAAAAKTEAEAENMEKKFGEI
ncbi:MAG TPA: phage terminase small subunit P27 family [Lachnospiraceae bacterium]|nr:phage terminase small subunit P27 family [Lachnospiraceae bacterium]